MKYIYENMQWKFLYYEDRKYLEIKRQVFFDFNNLFLNYYGKEELNLKLRLYC